LLLLLLLFERVDLSPLGASEVRTGVEVVLLELLLVPVGKEEREVLLELVKLLGPLGLLI
jgi:hypothetical protein